jgi:hypothetical protein
MSDYIKALYAEHDYDQIVTVVRSLRQPQTTEQMRLDSNNFNFLFFRKIHHEMGSALRTKEQVKLVKPCVDEALTHIDLRKFPWLVA